MMRQLLHQVSLDTWKECLWINHIPKWDPFDGALDFASCLNWSSWFGARHWCHLFSNGGSGPGKCLPASWLSHLIVEGVLSDTKRFRKFQGSDFVAIYRCHQIIFWFLPVFCVCRTKFHKALDSLVIDGVSRLKPAYVQDSYSCIPVAWNLTGQLCYSIDSLLLMLSTMEMLKLTIFWKPEEPDFRYDLIVYRDGRVRFAIGQAKSEPTPTHTHPAPYPTWPITGTWFVIPNPPCHMYGRVGFNSIFS